MVPTTTATVARLALLGHFEFAQADGASVAVSAPRHRALLTYLAMQPSQSSDRGQLAALLWDETDEASARHSLRQALLSLKKQLPVLDDLIDSDRETIRLRPKRLLPDAVDFEALLSEGSVASVGVALAMYHGGFGDTIRCDVRPFTEWRMAQRERFQLLLRNALEQHAGNPTMASAPVLKSLRLLTSDEPYDESLQRLLIRTLAVRVGSGAALSQAEAFVSQLRREISVEPEPETSRLISDIRAIPRMSTPQLPPATAPTDTSALPPKPLFGNVPARDLNFTGRAPYIEALFEALEAPSDRGNHRVAVHGLGGIGKSTLAGEFAHRYANRYSGVWWVRAEERTLLVEGLAALAAQLDRRLASETKQETAAIQGLKLLGGRDKPFLLIFDNVGSPDLIANLVPPAEVRVVITSRWPDWDGRATSLKLDVFDDGVAAEFLQKRAGRLDAIGAQRLARALGRLPLALDHAGAYCKMAAMSFDVYLKRIDTAIARAPRGAAYQTSITATFGLAIDVAAGQAAAAERLLGWISYLSAERIPLALFPETFISQAERDEALAALHAVSLIDPDFDQDHETVLSVHPLVQSAFRSRLSESGRQGQTIAEVTRMLAAAFPATAMTDPKVWPACAFLLGHALALRSLTISDHQHGPHASRLLHHVADFLHIRGSYREAEQIYREAISTAERLDDAGQRILSALHNSLGLLLSTVGRYSEAEPMLRRTIENGEKLLGRRHVDVAVRLNNLARLLSDTKRYDEAEPLFREAIAIVDQPTGGDPAFAVSWRNNLGILLNETGRNEEGERLYRDALDIAQRTLGTRHHETARCLNNLGRLLRDVSRYGEAADSVHAALAIWEKTLGNHHPVYARGQENYANILLSLGRQEDAMAAAVAALDVHRTTLGSGHFWTLDSARTYAFVLDAAGDETGASAVRQSYSL